MPPSYACHVRWFLSAVSPAQALKVKFVWPDESCSDADFCAWAGRALQDTRLRVALHGRNYPFSVLVHGEASARAAAYLGSSKTAQVSVLRLHVAALCTSRPAASRTTVPFLASEGMQLFSCACCCKLFVCW